MHYGSRGSISTYMPGASTSPPVPYARLTGSWEPLRRTTDGRTTVAVRTDERSGVAISYPFAEGNDGGQEVLQVAVVRNLPNSYALISANFTSMGGLPPGVRGADKIKRVALERYNWLTDETITQLLRDGTLVLVTDVEEQWFPGCLQLFDDPAAVSNSWLDAFPTLAERLAAVERITSGRDLRTVIESGSPIGERRFP